jgi:hypothetical protein
MEVKIFSSAIPGDLEQQINEWLKTLPYDDLVRHVTTTAYEWNEQPRFVVTVWYVLRV